MKVSYINGICVKNDAISNSIRDEIVWLGNEGRNEVCLYTYACDYDELPFKIVSGLKDIAFDPHFQTSDLVIFHFGVYYLLFNLLPIIPKKAKSLVVFHNITPKLLVPGENDPTIDKSFQQMANIEFADQVVCDSQTNLDVLQEAGIQTPGKVLSLAMHSEFLQVNSKPSFVDGVVRLAFVGRFVSSKGPLDLLEALHRLLQQNHQLHLQLDMVGNFVFSDSVLLENIQKTIDEIHGLYADCIEITIHGDATEDVKQKILCDADLFILPTYHEGFCVPILEALASGCKVIAYENSNTPAISGEFARLTPTGDIDAMMCALLESLNEVTSEQWKKSGPGSYAEYKQATWQYVQQYSPEQTKQRFLQFINQFIAL